jgi:guanylate kinase
MNPLLAYLLVQITSARLFLSITGPSGSGKTTLIRNMLAIYGELLRRITTCTTRPPRLREDESGLMEENGVDYHFFSREDFGMMDKRGDFAECTTMYEQKGEPQGDLYGSRREDILGSLAQGHSLLNADVQGIELLRRLASRDHTFPRPIDVFITPASLAVLERRLKKRNSDSPDRIARRLKTAQGEINQMQKFAYVIQSDKPEDDVKQLEAILTAELLKLLGPQLKGQLLASFPPS